MAPRTSPYIVQQSVLFATHLSSFSPSQRKGLALCADDSCSVPRPSSYLLTQIPSLVKPCMFHLTLASDLDRVESYPKRPCLSGFDLFLGHRAGWTCDSRSVSAHCTSWKQAKAVPGQEQPPGRKSGFKESYSSGLSFQNLNVWGWLFEILLYVMAWVVDLNTILAFL